MPHRFSKMVTASLGIILLFSVCPAKGQAPQEQKKPSKVSDTETKSVMAEILRDTKGILRFSLNLEAFSSEERRGYIQKQLDRLAEHSEVLRKHGVDKEVGFAASSATLARDAVDAKRWFERGRFAEARYIVHNMTEACVSCHLKLPDQDAALGQAFWQDFDEKNLADLEIIHLKLVTRRFGDALKRMESVFEDQAFRAADLALSDVLTSYLRVVVGVKQDYKRCDVTFAKLEARKDMPDYLKKQIGDWRHAVKHILANKRLVDEVTIDHARQLFRLGSGQMEFARDRDGLVFMVAASSQLNQLLEGSNLTQANRAEAYLLLGQIESLTAQSFWISSSNHYLESAIRLLPKSDTAKQAFSILEENTVMDYTGSSGTNIPDEIQSQLNELRKLAI